MECKAFPTGYVRGTRTYVLIETLWNVKTNFMQNDNIENLVLIETLWNVKDVLRELSSNGFQVLIETLWNVKELMNHVLRFSEGCINRNIMECKAGKKQQPVNTKHTY